MAYTNRQVNTEHPSKTIIKTVEAAASSGIWPRVVLLFGKEDFLVTWSKNYIKEKIVNPAAEALDCTVFEEDAPNPFDIIAACETLPLMSPKKLVIVISNELFSLQPKGITSEGIEALTSYIPNIPESTLLIFCCSKPNKTKAIYKAAAKAGLAYDFTPLDDATLSRWMAKRFNAAGKTANPQDLLSFAKYCGYGDPERNYTLNNLENDLKKVFASTNSEFITLDQMIDAGAPQGELNAFKLLDSAMSGKKNDAFSILHSTIEIQAPSKEMGAILSFLGLLCSQLEIMLESREREADGQNFYELLSDMAANEYRLKKAMASSRSKSIEELRGALNNAFQVEKDIKNGALDARTALELFIATL